MRILNHERLQNPIRMWKHNLMMRYDKMKNGVEDVEDGLVWK